MPLVASGFASMASAITILGMSKTRLMVVMAAVAEGIFRGKKMYHINKTPAELKCDLAAIRQAYERLSGIDVRPEDSLSLDDIVQHLLVSIEAGVVRQFGALVVEFNKLYSARLNHEGDGPTVGVDITAYVAKLLRGEATVADSLSVVRELEKTALMLESMEGDWSELYRAMSGLCSELGESYEVSPVHGYALADEIKRRIRRKAIRAIGD